ncbi:MAG: GNAT family N-acetyltransferase [Gammaproteobacteria bacterium]|nr:GNAT family N-acetyltransferase [Gammaproteobacteria bacterium]
MRHTGEWPGSIVLRHGLSKSIARPWNRDVPDAHLTLIRGTADFLSECADHLRAMGVPSVASSPLPSSATRLWKEAGYRPFERLDVFARELTGDLPDPGITVDAERAQDWDAVERVDRSSFEPFWRLDAAGLREAFTAAPRSVLLTARAPDLLGFSIVGVGSVAGYLQRIAVTPDAQGRGLGRSLVRASMQWAHRHGAREMLLNTLPNNDTASGLYVDEGFFQLDDHLDILRKG